MTEYQKKVFSNPQLLREKLSLYLQTPEKVEIYANACEKFFKAGNNEKLKYQNSWSWWGLFGGIFFLLYRKDIKIFSILLAILIVFAFIPVLQNINLPIAIIVAFLGKYLVCKKFEEALKSENDDVLKQKGGVYKWAIWIYIALMLIVIVSIVLLILSNNGY